VFLRYHHLIDSQPEPGRVSAGSLLGPSGAGDGTVGNGRKKEDTAGTGREKMVSNPRGRASLMRVSVYNAVRLCSPRSNFVSFFKSGKRQEAQVQKVSRQEFSRRKYSWMPGGAAALALIALAATSVWSQTPAQEKKVKDQAEYDLYNAVNIDLQKKDGAKMAADLDTWKQKYPDSDYKNDREAMYIQAYEMQKAWDKELSKAKELMGHDMDAMFPDPAQGPRQVALILFGAVSAAGAIQNPSPDQLAIGVEAANKLLAYKKEPAGLAPGAWATAKKDLDASANALLYRAAILPAQQATAKQDWATAESLWQKAMEQYPDKSMLPYQLGLAYRGEKKIDQSIWELARAVAMDPSLGGGNNPQQITTYVNNLYKSVHGSDEGLDKIEAEAKNSPNPPADFHVKTSMEIAQQQQQQFTASHPELAMWMNIKATLAGDQGPTYFESNMKGAQVPELTGTVLESACRAKTLQVAFPMPDATGAPVAEVTLKLVNDAGAPAPLTGKAETGSIKFKGVAEAFAKDPFMVTMTIEKKDIEGLKMTPCAAAPAGKKGVPSKKKK
jgi:hypothetical protein